MSTTPATDTLQSEPTTVDAHAVAYIQGKLDDMAKRAKRTGKPVPTLEVVREYTVKVHKGRNILGENVYVDVPKADIVVHGQRPVLEGWTIVANLVKVGEANVIRAVEDHGLTQEQMDHYRTAVNVCGHCGTKRQRNETWLFRADGTGALRQVAKNCCQDFVGATAIDLQAMASRADFVGNLRDPDFMGGAKDFESMLDVLAATAALVRVNGWVPKSRASEGNPATAGMVTAVIRAQSRPNDKYDGVLPAGPWPAIIADDYQAAADALAWIRTQGADTNDYIRNAFTACSVDYVLPKTLAIVASVVGAAYPNFLKRQAQDAEKAAKQAEAREQGSASDYVGNLKDRLTFDAKLVRVRQWEGNYGPTTLHVFEDNDGNLLQWYASGYHEREEGARYAVKGTVKRHQTDRYSGAKVTILTRCTLTGA